MGWLVGLMFMTHVVSAQSEGSGRQKIEAAKIGMITNRLNLTTDQAPQFWAVYNEYNAKKQELNRRVRQLNNGTAKNNLNDEQVVNGLRELNDTKQKLADLDEEYTSRFLKVITPAQLAQLNKTEQEFNRMLINRLKQE